jgi:anthranilate synthase component 1
MIPKTLVLEKSCFADEKRLPEHLPDSTWGRNVLAANNTVVSPKMFIERYSQVMHTASNVEGVVSPDKDA